MIILGHAAPMRIDHARALIARADAIFPVVLICKTSARPAQNRHLDLLQGFDDVIADAAGVGDRAVLTVLLSLVNAVPQVFVIMPVNVPVDDLLALISMNHEVVLLRSNRN